MLAAPACLLLMGGFGLSAFKMSLLALSCHVMSCHVMLEGGLIHVHGWLFKRVWDRVANEKKVGGRR